MAFSRKTWKDTIAQYPNRRQITHSNSTTELVTVARSVGTISQEGDAWNASNMNNLEGRIESEFNAVETQLAGFTLWKGTQAQYDALASHPNTTIYFILES